MRQAAKFAWGRMRAYRGEPGTLVKDEDSVAMKPVPGKRGTRYRMWREYEYGRGLLWVGTVPWLVKWEQGVIQKQALGWPGG